MKKAKEILVATLAMLALCAMGSDGDYFPWPNVAGMTILAIITSRITEREG